MVVDPQKLRLAMRHWTTGVTIVSVSYDGIRHGMTVSSFTSVSLLPPVVTISLEKDTRTHDLLLKAGAFGITILSSRQQDISERFAGRQTEYQDRFAGLHTHTLITGAPFIDGGLAYLDCLLISEHEFKTNTLFIGEVVSVKIENSNQPLVYYNQQYRRLQD